ncbi:hypothetical protein B0H11DRAFT_2251903 [Mycena galericulata]|nr:hypothetical protein B0H11DRAFT_2251903 [Mycena galericulata]
MSNGVEAQIFRAIHARRKQSSTTHTISAGSGFMSKHRSREEYTSEQPEPMEALAAAGEKKFPDNFAARFLPSLISAYKSWLGICSPYAAILFLLSASPYLVRYIRKTGQGYTLLSLCAHKMVQHPIPFTKDLYRDSAVLQSLSVMSHLLSYADTFPRQLVSLSNVSRKWGLTQTAYKLMGEVAELNAILLRNRTAEADMFYIPWLDCGSHQKHCVNDPCLDDECLHEDPLMLKNQRKQCSRCKATAYCSKEHQKLDWPRKPF